MVTQAMRIVLILFFASLSLTAWGQEGHHGEGHSTWHGNFYQNLRSPKTKNSCCYLSDCRPTSGRMIGNHYEVQVGGTWVSVPWDIVVKTTAPDLGFHVCAPDNFDGIPEHLYCVILAPEM